jgi:hypothetical protein
MTPRQFHALRKRFEQEQQHKELLSAMVAANVVNYSIAHPEKPVHPRDFMPSQWNQEARKPKVQRLTARRRKDIASSLRNMFAAARPKDKQ